MGARFVTEGGEKQKFMENLEVNLGLVGSVALGEHVQSEWLRLVNIKQPQGWNNPLENEPGCILFYDWKWPFRPTW